MKMYQIFTVSMCVIALAGCQTTQTQMPSIAGADVAAEQLRQKSMAFERDERFLKRLRNVALPILKSSTEICGEDVRHDFGFIVADRSEYDRDFRDGFAERYGPGKRPYITLVNRDTPAFEAGLVRGHEVLMVNGEETRDRSGSAERLRKDIRESEEDRTPLVLKVAKDGATREVTLNGVLACDYGIQLTNDTIVNAFADGDNIIFTVGMMRFAETDEELATVVGHEIAHNVMKHPQSSTTGAVVGGLLGVLVDSAAAAGGGNTGGFYTDLGMNMGARAFSVEKEQEADYVGLYLMERGGFDSSDVANFWRRMGAENPNAIERTGIPFMDTHPSAPERFLSLQAIHQEIVDKRAAGEALLPNMKK